MQSNPNFLQAAGIYLQDNGYQCSKGAFFDQNTIYFSKGEKAVAIKNDAVDFIAYEEGEPEQRSPSFTRYLSFTGIAQLDLFKWMMLFHIADIVVLKVQEVKDHIPHLPTAHDPNEDLLKHFRLIRSERIAPIPVNY